MNGVGIGIAALITSAVQATIRQVPLAGRTVCYGAVAGITMPITAGLRVGITTTRAAAATLSASGSAGQVCKLL